MESQNTIYATTLAATGFLALLLVLLPRKYIMLPFVLGACFIPADQRMIIGGLDFTPLRILVVVGLLSMFLRGPQWPRRLNDFDLLVINFAICGALIYYIQWETSDAIIHQSGVLFDVFGMYLIFTRSLGSWESVRLTLKIFAVCSIITAVFVAVEWATGKNPFMVLGKVHTVIRDGRYRCAGPFPHSIISGLFWGMLVPVFIGIVMTQKQKLLYSAAAIASIFIVVASASSTPLLSLLVVLGGTLVFKWRRFTPLASWCMVAMLTFLHFVMQKPVWHLLARLDIIGGSSGWHRYILVDRAIKHFNEWAILGCRSTEHWGWGMQDITNQFVYEGVRGGIFALIFFLILLFVMLRTALRCSLRENAYQYRVLSWCFFVSVAGHCVSFLSVSYFGQIMMLWYMTLAVTAFLSGRTALLSAETVTSERERKIIGLPPTLFPEQSAL